MRRLIILIIALVVAVWIGVKIAEDPGYVLLSYQTWTIEMPLWFTAIALIFSFIILYFLARLLRHVSDLPARLRAWSKRRRERSVQHFTHQGLLALAAGKWTAAEKKLLKAARHNAAAWMNYIGAARAAYEQGDSEKRDRYLQHAVMATTEAEVAVGLEQAQVQIEQQQLEQALATLQRLHQIVPKQNYILRLLLQVCASLKDWQMILELLPKARKQQALPETKLSQLEIQAYQGLLNKLVQQKEVDIETIKEKWQQIPRALRNHDQLLHVYAQILIARKEYEEAEQLIRHYLKRLWSEDLAYDYGLFTTEDPDDQLAYAEKWLPGHENNAALLLTLGRLCLANQLWGKARSYLETSLSIEPRAETYLELAKLAEQLNEKQSAYDAYRKGLALTLQKA